jgi:aspartate aminotransferase
MNPPLAATSESTPLALAGARESLRRMSLENISTVAGAAIGDPSIIPLWFGEGDLATPAFVGEAMARAVRAGQTFYTFQNGIPELRQTLADYLTGLNQRPVQADRITVTGGGMAAIMLSVQLVAETGDNIIVIDPVWPNIAGMTQLVGAESRSVRMDLGPDGWSLDLDKVAAAMDERTRAVIFASPANPTGAMIPTETQIALLDLCRARGVWVVADEVYNRLVFGRRNAASILDHAEPEDRVLVINSFSKSWAMTGWRLGWLTHPPSLGPTLAMMIQYTSTGVTTALQHAGVAAVRNGEPFVKQMRDYCEAGVTLVHNALERFGRVRVAPRPVAGMYAMFEVDGMSDSREACLSILRQTRVGLAPGYFFGPGSNSYLRLCACRAPAVLAEAMERLEPALR